MKKNVADFIEASYTKLKLLKRSERGEVWLADTKANGDLVIIKRMALTGLPYDLIKKFSFKLPAKVLYCTADEAETVIVEEFIQGENLSAREKHLSEPEARKILLQMCDGLKELHEQKIIHRDIKPSNLILQGERIRLIDFDAARIFKDEQEKDTEPLGTKGYAPPEQFGLFGLGQTDPRSDIYSLGVTMKTLLGANYNGRLKKILDKCTELNPAQRFQSVSDLKTAVRLEQFSYWGKIFAAIFFAATIFMTIGNTVGDIKNPLRSIVEDKISDEVSLGGLKLGDSIETVHEIFGKENEIRASENLPATFYYEYNDIIVTVKNNLIIGVETYTDTVKDARGIRQGDSLDKVIAAYGAESWKVESEGDVTFYEYPFESESGNLVVMRFAIKNDFVEYISLRLDK